MSTEEDYEALNVLSFDHRPILSRHDGSIASCKCMDRVFIKGKEDWDQHIADAILAAGFRRTPAPAPAHSDYHEGLEEGIKIGRAEAVSSPQITDTRLREAADRMSPLSKTPYTSLDLALVREAAYRASERHEPEITVQRPPDCCGVCPPIVGGYDCTCAGNLRCPNYEGDDE